MAKHHTILLTRRTERLLNNDSLNKQAHHLVSRALAGNRGGSQGWQAGKPKFDNDSQADGGYLFRMTLTFVKKSARKTDKQTEENQWNRLVQIIDSADPKWLVTQVDGGTTSTTVVATGSESGIVSDTYEPIDIGLFDDKEKYFSEIYGRDAQISLIESAIKAFVRSDYKAKHACLLHGVPGSGKTEVLRSFKKLLNASGDSVLELDQTMTTVAGISNLLLDSSVLPRIIIVEEIEKTDQADLRYMLSLLDTRGEVRKTNARRGNQVKKIDCLVLATSNSIDILGKMMDGALLSRFANLIHCPKPDRDVLEKILHREISKLKDGDPAWIEPALDYCLAREISDPRKCLSICICGAENLLTGKYQGWLDETSNYSDDLQVQAAA